MRFKTAGTYDVAWFDKSGLMSINDNNKVLEIVSREIKSFDSILDFGCGAGRMLRWCKDYPNECKLLGLILTKK